MLNIEKYGAIDIGSNAIRLLIVTIMGMLNLFVTISNSIVKIRKMLVVVLLMLILGLLTMFLNKFDFIATLIVISIPLSIIVANFFQNIKRPWLAELLFSSLLVSVLLGYFL